MWRLQNNGFDAGREDQLVHRIIENIGYQTIFGLLSSGELIIYLSIVHPPKQEIR